MPSLPGTYQECFYALMCLGIPPEAIPISEGGEMEPMFHQQWLARRRWLEQNASRD